MKKLLLICALFTGMLCFSCSSDNDDHEEEVDVRLLGHSCDFIAGFDFLPVDSLGNSVINDSNYVDPYIVRIAFKNSDEKEWSLSNCIPPFGNGDSYFPHFSVVKDYDRMKSSIPYQIIKPSYPFVLDEKKDTISCDILLNWGYNRSDTITVVSKYWIKGYWIMSEDIKFPLLEHIDFFYLNGKKTESPIRIILDKIKQ